MQDDGEEASIYWLSLEGRITLLWHVKSCNTGGGRVWLGCGGRVVMEGGCGGGKVWWGCGGGKRGW